MKTKINSILVYGEPNLTTSSLFDISTEKEVELNQNRGLNHKKNRKY